MSERALTRKVESQRSGPGREKGRQIDEQIWQHNSQKEPCPGIKSDGDSNASNGPRSLARGSLPAARHICQQPLLGASDRPRKRHQTKQARAWVRGDEQIARPCCGERWPSRAAAATKPDPAIQGWMQVDVPPCR